MTIHNDFPTSATRKPTGFQNPRHPQNRQSGKTLVTAAKPNGKTPGFEVARPRSPHVWLLRNPSASHPSTMPGREPKLSANTTNMAIVNESCRNPNPGARRLSAPRAARGSAMSRVIFRTFLFPSTSAIPRRNRLSISIWNGHLCRHRRRVAAIDGEPGTRSLRDRHRNTRNFKHLSGLGLRRTHRDRNGQPAPG